MPTFKVGVFCEDGRRARKYRAYTTWFNPAWPGCRVFDVVADNGTEAKAGAIACAKLEDARATSAPTSTGGGGGTP